VSFSPTEPKNPARHPAGFEILEVTLPELEARAVEAVVVAWDKRPGDRVEQGQPICIVSSDGRRAAVASSASGRLRRLLAGVGTRVGPGASLAEIELEATSSKVEERTVSEHATETVSTFQPLGDDDAAPDRRTTIDRSSFHSPAVKRLAAEHQIDLSLLSGSGTGGRIRKEDLLAHLEGAVTVDSLKRPGVTPKIG
jgi:2-oxoisovalerate dehydrogenase E2 component (dihydrolipoyl transacylase)